MEKEETKKNIFSILNNLLLGENQIAHNNTGIKTQSLNLIPVQDRKFIQDNWINLMGKSQHLMDLLKVYNKEREYWNNLKEEYKNSSDNGNVYSFLEKYFEKNIIYEYKEGNIKDNDIKELVDYRKPKIRDLYTGKYLRFYNFLIYSNKYLKMNLHISFSERREDSFLLVAVYSFLLEKPEKNQDLNREFVLKNYKNQMLVLDLFNKLISMDYNKIKSDWKDKSSQNIDTNLRNEWTKKPPLFFKTYFKSIINVNPRILIEIISEDIFNTITFIKKENRKRDYDPKDWFDSLEFQIKDFINQGKQLFLKTSGILESPEREVTDTEIKGEIKKAKNKSFTFDDIIILFKKAYQEDKKNEVPKSSRGYRTKNQIYDEYISKDSNLDMDKTEIYVSKTTFYKIFNDCEEQLSLILQKSEEQGEKGGTAYRYMKRNDIKSFPKNEELNDKTKLEYKKEQMKIHQALVYYEAKQYKESKEIFSELVNNASKSLRQELETYFGVIYHLGKNYFKLKDYKSAINYFKKIFEKDSNKFDIGFDIVRCYYQMGKYNRALKLVNDFYSRLKKILEPYSFLNKQEILFPKEFMAPGVLHLKEIPDNLKNEVILSKFLLMFNRNYRELDFPEFKPQNTADWEKYKKDKQKYGKVRKRLNKNIFQFKTLKFLFYDLFYFKLELNRKIFLEDLIFLHDREKFKQDVIQLSKGLYEEIHKDDIQFKRIKNFLFYIQDLTSVFNVNKKGFKSTYNNLFPELQKSKPEFSKFFVPKNSREFDRLIFLTHSMIKRKRIEPYIDEFKEMINEPKSENITEFYLLRLISFLNNQIEDLINDFKKKLDSIQEELDKDIYYLITEWGYDNKFKHNHRIRYYQNLVKKGIEICQQKSLDKYRTVLEELSKRMIHKYQTLKKIKSKGRRVILNNFFKKYYHEFHKKSKTFPIEEYREKPKNFNFELIKNEIIDRINYLGRKEIPREKIFKIYLFNSNFTKEFSKILEERFKPPHKLKVDLENNIIELRTYKELQKKYGLDVNIYFNDILIDGIFYSIKKMVHKVIIRVAPELKKQYKHFFNERFPDSTNNPYFQFLVEEYQNGLSYLITIIKKEEQIEKNENRGD